MGAALDHLCVVASDDLTNARLLTAAGAQARSPLADTPHAEVDLRLVPSEPEALALIPESYAIERHVLPLQASGGVLVVACADPNDAVLLREVQVVSRSIVRARPAPAAEIEAAIRERYKVLAGVEEHVRAFALRRGTQQVVDGSDEMTQGSPVVEVVNLLIAQGLRDRASDIHIEPQQNRLRVRFRIDGILTDALSLPKSMAPALASRLKVMANMDIVDRHRAQDGQIRTHVDDRPIDIRVSTAETIWGEKVVLRLLDQGRTFLDLDQLGLNDTGDRMLRRLLGSPYGMVVVSGPTGSGKTTTLYAALRELDPQTQNIVTIEDPVEYTLEDINQIQIRRVANLNFANGLKAVLRQDPDVILIGEIRDMETAEIAIQSALTGHLVLSSLHATDAAGVIQRFLEMGIEGYLVSSALIGVVAQRLVRRICTACGERYQPTPPELALWQEHGGGEHDFVRGAGCGACAGTGYKGRIGVFEVLSMTDEMKRLVSARVSAQEIRDMARYQGTEPLRAAGVSMVKRNVTTLAEVIRCVWVN
jgi:type IV pilus assembly protein PilB